MHNRIDVPPIPVDELDEDGVNLHCAGCDEHLTEEACFDGDEAYYCKKCMDELVERLTPEAKKWAQAHCKITQQIPEYDSQCEYRCTADEYNAGMRESYTPNAYRCHCRHNCTNYDELIKNLSRDYVPDQVRYNEIYDRIDELLDDAEVEMLCEADESDETDQATE